MLSTDPNKQGNEEQMKMFSKLFAKKKKVSKVDSI